MALQGKIALIYDRDCVTGLSSFRNSVTKIRNAQRAGAIAVVFINHIDVPPVRGLYWVGVPSDMRIPAVLVSMVDGIRLRDALATGRVELTLAADISFRRGDEADTLDRWTSRGPVFRSSRLNGDGEVSISVSALTVPAQDTTVFQITLAADPARLDDLRDPTSPDTQHGFPRQQLPEASGEIWLQGDGVSLHLRWYTVLRATAQFAATAAHIGAPTGQVSLVHLPTRGASAHAMPLVSAFQLGATHPNRKYPDYRASTDLVAFGAATDYLTSGSISNATLYFGLATAGHWVTPQHNCNGFEVKIDLNSDDRPDYTIINANTGSYAAGDVDAWWNSTDALISVVRSEATGHPSAAGPLNKLEPSVRDTSPFLNGVMVHAVRAADIGLTSARSSFRYRVVTLDSSNDSDFSSWITFNAARPVVDATPLGIDGTPFFDEGRDVVVNLHRENAGTATSTRWGGRHGSTSSRRWLRGVGGLRP